MPRFHSTPEGNIPFTPEEEAARDAVEAAELEARPMRDWLISMAETDKTVPRWLEDHITSDHGGTAGNPVLQANYEAKILLRGNKP